MTVNPRALIIFARKPEAGKVKTRLAATMGNDKALAIYIRLLEHTRFIADELSCEKYVFLTHERHDDFWNGFVHEIQQGDTLGDKLRHAFELLFEKGHEHIIVIGSDCPDITPEIVEEGYLRLTSHDIVIGPAEDGGYYLLGMNKYNAALFQEVKWSSEVVFTQTIEKIDAHNLSYYTMPMLTDVDEEKDLPKDWL